MLTGLDLGGSARSALPHVCPPWALGDRKELSGLSGTLDNTTNKKKEKKLKNHAEISRRFATQGSVRIITAVLATKTRRPRRFTASHSGKRRPTSFTRTLFPRRLRGKLTEIPTALAPRSRLIFMSTCLPKKRRAAAHGPGATTRTGATTPRRGDDTAPGTRTGDTDRGRVHVSAGSRYARYCTVKCPWGCIVPPLPVASVRHARDARPGGPVGNKVETVETIINFGSL